MQKLNRLIKSVFKIHLGHKLTDAELRQFMIELKKIFKLEDQDLEDLLCVKTNHDSLERLMALSVFFYNHKIKGGRIRIATILGNISKSIGVKNV